MARNLLQEVGPRNLTQEVSGPRNLYQETITPDISKPRNLDTEPEGHWEGWIKPTLKKIGEAATVGTIETIAAVGSGMALWPVSKIRGVGELMRGKSVEEARQAEQEVMEAGYQPRTESGKGATELVGKGFEAALTPARMAGEGATELIGPKTGYLVELGGELAMFKMAHGAKAKITELPKQKAAAKTLLDKKLSDLTEPERAYVNDVAKTKLQPRNVLKEKVAEKQDPLEKAYETQKDIWLGERDVRVFEAEIESRLLKKEIKTKAPKKTGPKIDEAIQIYIDTKRNPEHITKYYDKLKPEQKSVVDLSQNLPGYAREIANKIEQSYKKIGTEGLDAAVLRNTIDNYASRQWDLGKEKPVSGLRKFGTKTGHAKARKYKTIIEGWADGKDLKLKTATENLKEYKKEIVKTIEDKRFVEQLRKVKNIDGEPLLSTQKLEGYVDVEHPNMSVWEWAGTTKKGISVSPEFFQELKDLGEQIKKLRIETEKETSTTTTAESTLAGGKLAESGPLVKLEGVVRGSLTARGMTENEANVYIRKLKSNGAAAVNESLKEISKKTETTRTTLKSQPLENQIIEVSTPKTVETGKVYGKNFFATEDGTLFERRRLYAPKSQAKNINNILGMSKLEEVPGVKELTKFNAITKAWILQTSLFHHQAFMRSFYLPGADWGQFKSPREAYRSGIKAIESSDPVVMHGVRNGLTLGLKQDWHENLLREKTSVGRFLDKAKATKTVKDSVNKFRESQADFLFGEFGAGLKARSYIDTFGQQVKKYPNENPDVISKRVAALINDDYGGLHLQRLGRNPTLQHVFRLAALAPDWTESNIRTMVKTLKNKNKSQQELAMYRKFWGGVVVKGVGLTALLNYATAGGDVDKMLKNYEKAWRAGNFNWAKVDITPIYEFFGGEKGKRKYFSVLGHFQDPLKFAVHPLKSAKHKQSVVSGIGFEAVTGTDWAGRRFTSLDDLLSEGKTVEWGGKKGPIDYEQFPAYVLSQLMGTQPIQSQNAMGYFLGDIDGFDAISKSVGMHTTSTYKEKKKGLKKLSGLKN